MRQWFAIKCLTVVTLCGVLAACAQSPQILAPDPQVSGNFPQVGNGQSITLNVVDGRPDNIIGTRSGEMSATSTITVEANSMIPKVRAQAEGALRSMGFNPVAQNSGATTLTLTVAKLDYARGYADQPVLAASQLEAIIEAQAESGTNTYAGRYTSRRKQSYAFKPDWDDNNAMVSELLGDALDRTFRDQQLANLLAR